MKQGKEELIRKEEKEMKATTFNIQKFSIHDGPGIRTTIFLKGCPLRCAWCANPESQKIQIEPIYDAKKCIHCLACLKACPQGALVINEELIQRDEKKCVNCLACTKVCPSKAMKVEGEQREIDEIVRLCLQDIDFYEQSNGGVTISGGEGMIQPEAVKALAKALKGQGVHLAIETTGQVSFEVFSQIAPLFDLLLFDVKHYDSAKHKEKTGVGNHQIIHNLKWAVDQGIEILPRIPVIPGFNNDLVDAKGVAELLKQVGLTKIQLLPFHQMGENKYALLQRSYPYQNIKALHPEDLKDYQQVFLQEGIDAFF